MNSRERVISAILHEPPDRIPCDDAFWKDTLLRFYSESMPENIHPVDYFNFDIDHIYMDVSPRLPEKIINEDQEQITYVSKHGFSAKKWKNKDAIIILMLLGIR